MSIISILKSELNFAIFRATSDCINPNQSLQGYELQFFSHINLCQKKLNNLSNKSFSPPKQGIEKLKKLKEKVKKKIEELEKELIKASGYIKKDLESRIKNLKSAINELDKLIYTATNYQFLINKTAPQFNYNPQTDTAIVEYDGTIGGLLNELKHAFQFETGKIEFIKVANADGSTNIIPGLTYDLIDEVETYQRQYAYDGILKLTLEVSEEDINNQIKNLTDLSKLLNNSIEIKKMNKISADIIIKVSDGSLKSGLYKSISKKSLDVNSSIDDIIKNNTQRANWVTALKIDKEDKRKPYIEFIKVYIKNNPHIYVK